MLKSSGPTINLCGIPKRISYNLLYSLSNFSFFKITINKL